ncbi:MAG: hypothetical protein JW810_08490 [Sedimentisphaerales bacterium]|nr:hypothetical protein [Sedimentisphaerales bacterium]
MRPQTNFFRFESIRFRARGICRIRPAAVRIALPLLYLALVATAPAGAKVNGDCAVNSSTGFCQFKDKECKITVDGVSKDGKCKSHTVATIGGVCVCTPNDGSKVQETKANAAPSSGPGPVPPAPATIEFIIAPPPGEGTIALVPEFLGGGMVFVPDFAGAVSMQILPGGSPDLDVVQIIGGMADAGPVMLPNGQSTGFNHFEFAGPGILEGTLDRTTGAFFFTATGVLTNELFPPSRPIETVGQYFGLVDMATGEAQVDTTTFDLMPPPCDGGYLPGDLNGDCYVNLLDFYIMATHWLACNEPADPDCWD